MHASAGGGQSLNVPTDLASGQATVDQIAARLQELAAQVASVASAAGAAVGSPVADVMSEFGRLWTYDIQTAGKLFSTLANDLRDAYIEYGSANHFGGR